MSEDQQTGVRVEAPDAVAVACGAGTTARAGTAGRRNRRRWSVAGTVAVLAALSLTAQPLASALTGSPAASAVPAAARPVTAAEIPNVDLVKKQIAAYYGDTVAANGEHYPSPTSDYATETVGIVRSADTYLRAQRSTARTAKPAIVLDVDDTSLNTYNYEILVNYAYTPASNAAWVNAQKGIAVFGVPDLANDAERLGYTVFWLTGRPEEQRSATAANLAKVGFTSTADATHLYLRNRAKPPAYLACEPTCTTVQYKSATREHIESLGYDIVANFGDQQSDLTGGFADKTYKLPNPMYYLP